MDVRDELRDKELIRSVSIVVSLNEPRKSGALGPKGTAELLQAESLLASYSGRAVTSAFLAWFDAGQRRVGSPSESK